MTFSYTSLSPNMALQHPRHPVFFLSVLKISVVLPALCIMPPLLFLSPSFTLERRVKSTTTSGSPLLNLNHIGFLEDESRNQVVRKAANQHQAPGLSGVGDQGYLHLA